MTFEKISRIIRQLNGEFGIVCYYQGNERGNNMIRKLLEKLFKSKAPKQPKWVRVTKPHLYWFCKLLLGLVLFSFVLEVIIMIMIQVANGSIDVFRFF